MTLAFPQLSTGALAQFPIRKTRMRRTIRNVAAGGSEVRHNDSGAGRVLWELPFRALTSAEADALAQLFETAEGRLRTFTFIDPLANLLTWSGDYARSAWQKGPLLQFTPGTGDPFGGVAAVTVVNGGQAPQRLTQTMDAPGWFQYCLSIYARSIGGANLSLVRANAAGQAAEGFTLNTDWQRAVSTGALAGAGGSITFAIELPPGASVDLYGAQAEAQKAPSACMETGPKAGLYPNTRFDQDELLITAQGPGILDTMVRLVSPDGD